MEPRKALAPKAKDLTRLYAGGDGHLGRGFHGGDLYLVPKGSLSEGDGEIVEEVAERIRPVFEHLRRQAADGELLHNDDTSVRILELMKENAQPRTQDCRDGPIEPNDSSQKKKKRTGMFTTAVVSVVQENKIAIFYTGRNHAGESLAELLKERTSTKLPIQMCDALSRNIPKEFKTLFCL